MRESHLSEYETWDSRKWIEAPGTDSMGFPSSVVLWRESLFWVDQRLWSTRWNRWRPFWSPLNFLLSFHEEWSTRLKQTYFFWIQIGTLGDGSPFPQIEIVFQPGLSWTPWETGFLGLWYRCLGWMWNPSCVWRSLLIPASNLGTPWIWGSCCISWWGDRLGQGTIPLEF